MEQQIRVWQAISWKAVSDRSKDVLIAFVIAVIGLVGSYIILGKSISNSSAGINPEFSNHESSETNIFLSGTKNTGALKSINEAHLIVQGIFVPDQLLKVSYMNFVAGKKYMIDYGNGIRRIIGTATNYIKYQEPGIYYVVFYEMIGEQWEVVSTQAISIKPESSSEISSK